MGDAARLFRGAPRPRRRGQAGTLGAHPAWAPHQPSTGGATRWTSQLPFAQRFTATIGDDGDTIAGRWEKAPDGRGWETDFDLTYRRVG